MKVKFIKNKDGLLKTIRYVAETEEERHYLRNEIWKNHVAVQIDTWSISKYTSEMYVQGFALTNTGAEVKGYHDEC